MSFTSVTLIEGIHKARPIERASSLNMMHWYDLSCKPMWRLNLRCWAIVYLCLDRQHTSLVRDQMKFLSHYILSRHVLSHLATHTTLCSVSMVTLCSADQPLLPLFRLIIVHSLSNFDTFFSIVLFESNIHLLWGVFFLIAALTHYSGKLQDHCVFFSQKLLHFDD